MAKVLISSCFNASPNDEQWCRLQTHFLNKTVTEHKVAKLAVLRAGAEPALYQQYGYQTVNQYACKHADGADFLLDYFKNSDYDYLCFLDSDAWPVTSNWVEKCIEWTNLSNGSNTERCGVAAVRFELLEPYPHPCVFFVNKNFVDKGRDYFSIPHERRNLLNQRIVDLFTELDLKFFYPLLRTNKINYHPVGAAIYHNTFYHHVAGSRGFSKTAKVKLAMRDCNHEYYSHYEESFCQPIQLTNMLLENPDKFIKSLMY